MVAKFSAKEYEIRLIFALNTYIYLTETLYDNSSVCLLLSLSIKHKVCELQVVNSIIFESQQG